ncbi:MAG: rRNA maturation RNase YbeY [Patescibacteria group bacterium]
MTNIVIIRKTDYDVLGEDQIKAIASEALSRLNAKNNLEMEIIFVDEDEIKKLNNKHRHIDKATDVLSFPQTFFKSNEINILGSVVICPKIADEREEPIEELIKHGILHLCGYDHEADEAVWLKAAEKIDCNF